MRRDRIYTFDIVKGIAILFVIPLHALIYQVGESNPGLFEPIISGLSREIMIMLAPIIILSLWGPIFTQITGANIAYGFLKVYQRNPNESSAYILRRILAAVLLIFVSRTAVFVFEGGLIGFDSFDNLDSGLRYYADTLDSIALTNILVPLLILLIINRIKVRKLKKSGVNTDETVKPRYIYIGLGIVTALWFLFTPVVQALKPYIHSVSEKHNWKLLLLLYSKMTTGRFRFFPILGFGYVGGIVGTAIFFREKFRDLRKYTGLFFALALIAFVVWCFLVENPVGNVATDDNSNMLQILVLGAMTFALVLMLGRYDYCPQEVRSKRIERTLFVRRFSMVTLTIYIMEYLLAYGVYHIFEQFWETAVGYVDEMPVLNWGITQIVTFILVICVIWIVIVRLWEKVDFAGSLEWVTLKLGALFLRQHHVRINSRQILYGQQENKDAHISAAAVDPPDSRAE
ncbi:MAG: acyltransferase family protein [Fidelibacterota bacterium]